MRVDAAVDKRLADAVIGLAGHNKPDESRLRHGPAMVRSFVIGVLLVGCAAAERDEEAVTVELGGDPANGAVFALDVSHWEGPLSQHEIDCFWANGVRHLVAGTQRLDLARQQLDMAESRGMTIDAYVYLYWDQSPAAQVAEAFARVDGFPIGRMWLDVEESPGGRSASTMIGLLREASDACIADGGADCGIYTRGTFWQPALGNTTQFAELPLWYARYNYKPSLDSWQTERFGGWTFPAAKQWAEEALCSVGVDKNAMQVITAPTLVIDRSPPPPPTSAPAAPTRIYPADGATIVFTYAKLMAASIAHATSWQHALEVWNGTAWTAYYTWTSTLPYRKTNPPMNRYYRLRVRARNTFGWGPWSTASVFAYGQPTGSWPGASPPPPPPATVPTGLAPDGTVVSTPSVTMTWVGVTGASRYEVAIERQVGTAWQAYTTYSTTATSKTFWPQTHGVSYRFRVRAIVGSAPTEWSALATFAFS